MRGWVARTPFYPKHVVQWKSSILLHRRNSFGQESHRETRTLASRESGPKANPNMTTSSEHMNWTNYYVLAQKCLPNYSAKYGE